MSLKVKLLKYDLNILNWKQLNEKYNFNCDSDKNFLINFLELGLSVDEFKGYYCFVYELNNKIYLFRDIVGVKPLFYKNYNFDYSIFYKKDFIELDPKYYLIYDIKNNKISKFERSFFESFEILDDYKIIKQNVYNLFLKSIKNLLELNNFKKIGVLFSGGTDSTLIVLMLKKIGIEFECFTASISGGNISVGEDIIYAKEIADELKIKLNIIELDFDKVEKYTIKLIKLISDNDYTKICVALPLFVALTGAKKKGIDFVFSGIGSEEIFGDYRRGENIKNINKICFEGLKTLWIRDLYRDYSLAKETNINLVFPFLDNDFIKYSININPKYKINKYLDNKNDKLNIVTKLILRDILNDFNLSKKFIIRPKKAAQYGSKSARVYEKLANKMKIKKQDYLNNLNLK